MGSPSRNVQYHPPRLSEDRLNLPQPHSPSLPTHCSGKSGMRPRSIHVSSTPDRRKNSAAAMVNPHIRARAPTTTVTYDGRTLGPFPASPPVSVRYRQGRDRPCAGLRWPRTVNRGRRLLAMPSKLLPTPHSAVAAGLDIQGAMPTGMGMVTPDDCRHGRRRRSAQPSSTRSALLA